MCRVGGNIVEEIFLNGSPGCCGDITPPHTHLVSRVWSRASFSFFGRKHTESLILAHLGSIQRAGFSPHFIVDLVISVM